MSIESEAPVSESTEAEVTDESTSEETEGELSETEGQPAEAEVEQLQDEIEQAIENGASKKEIKSMIEEYELKVNGKTVKAKLDLSDKEAVKRELQKAYAFNDVSQEYANVKKALNDRITIWKQKPEQALMDLGIDPKEWAEMVIAEEVENLKKDPQQLKLEEMQRKVAEYEAKEAKMREHLEQQKQIRMDQEALQTLREEIQEALSKHSYLKPNEFTERRIADMMAHYSEKYPDITAEQVLPAVEQELKREFHALMEALPDDFVNDFLGENNVKRISSRLTKPKYAPVVTPPKKPNALSQTVKPTTAALEAVQKNPSKKPTFEEIMSRRR